jgi:hypothetical protein
MLAHVAIGLGSSRWLNKVGNGNLPPVLPPAYADMPEVRENFGENWYGPMRSVQH